MKRLRHGASGVLRQLQGARDPCPAWAQSSVWIMAMHNVVCLCRFDLAAAEETVGTSDISDSTPLEDFAVMLRCEGCGSTWQG